MQNKSSETARGKDASVPTEIPAKGWWSIVKRVKAQLAKDHVQIVSAGIAFYLFLSLFPVLAATVATYGLVTDPAEAESQIESLQGFLPADVFSVIGDMVKSIASEAGDTLGWSVILSILVSLWGANKGTKAMVTGLNIAYDETEERGAIRLNLVTLGLTLGFFFIGMLLVALVAGIPIVLGNTELPSAITLLIQIARWPVLAALAMAILAALYHWAPSRDAAKWSWVSPGALVAAILWLAGSALFSVYIENFGSMSKTYGPFAAVVTLMLWLFLTAYVVLLGAEINAESERQTKKDTTKGAAEPMGSRDAYAADHVAGGDDAE